MREKERSIPIHPTRSTRAAPPRRRPIPATSGGAQLAPPALRSVQSRRSRPTASPLPCGYGFGPSFFPPQPSSSSSPESALSSSPRLLSLPPSQIHHGMVAMGLDGTPAKGGRLLRPHPPTQHRERPRVRRRRPDAADSHGARDAALPLPRRHQSSITNTQSRFLLLGTPFRHGNPRSPFSSLPPSL